MRFHLGALCTLTELNCSLKLSNLLRLSVRCILEPGDLRSQSVVRSLQSISSCTRLFVTRKKLGVVLVAACPESDNWSSSGGILLDNGES